MSDAALAARVLIVTVMTVSRIAGTAKKNMLYLLKVSGSPAAELGVIGRS
jgi:hypothetical protein